VDVTLNFRMPEEVELYNSAIHGDEYRNLLRELPEIIGTALELDPERIYQLIRAARIDRGLRE